MIAATTVATQLSTTIQYNAIQHNTIQGSCCEAPALNSQLSLVCSWAPGLAVHLVAPHGHMALCLCITLERMTIHYYKANQTNQTFRGMPWVWNFTDSQSFLKVAILRVEVWSLGEWMGMCLCLCVWVSERVSKLWESEYMRDWVKNAFSNDRQMSMSNYG